MQILLEEILKNLCKRCPDDLTKKKQKLLAMLSTKFIDSIEDVSIDIKHITDALHIMCKLHSEKRETPGNILLQYVSENKLSVLNNLLNGIQKQDLNIDEINELTDLIQKKYQSLQIFNKVDNIVEELLELKSLESDLDVVSQFKNIIAKEYTNIIIDEEDTTEIELDSGINTSETIRQIRGMAQRKPLISSGFTVLDEFLNGGFEASRIYMLGGKPGLGKSSLLLNFFCNMMQTAITVDYADNTKKDALVYITLENDIIETFQRTVRILTRETIKLRDASDDEIESASIQISSLAQRKIFIKYMPPYITSTIDVFVYLSKISETYNIVGVFVDHVDLLVSSQHHQEKRHDLGIATMDLKTMATKFSCPLIVPSHLNTGGYDGIPTMKHLQESRQKAQNSDTVALMFEVDFSLIPPKIYAGFNPASEKFIGINIDKNRDGPRGILIAKFIMDLFTFEFLDKNTTQQIVSAMMNRNFQQNNHQNNVPVDF